MAMEGKVSIIDTTQQLEWEVTKEAYDNCAFPGRLTSPVFKIHVGKEELQWTMRLWPNGYVGSEDKGPVNDAAFKLQLSPANVKYFVKVNLAMKDSDGKLHLDFIKMSYANHFNLKKTDTGKSFDGHGDAKDRRYFRPYPKEMLHRLILASMSTTFKTMLTNDSFAESKELVVEIVDSNPKIVEAMIYFMNNGVIPPNIDAISFDLIHLAQKYDLKDLIKACERSLVNNMAVENVINTLITLDLYVPTSEFRQKVIEFIKSNAKEVIKVKDWTKFVQNYPNLVTEVVLSFANQS